MTTVKHLLSLLSKYSLKVLKSYLALMVAPEFCNYTSSLLDSSASSSRSSLSQAWSIYSMLMRPMYRWECASIF